MFSGALVGAAVQRGQSAIAEVLSTLSPAPRPRVAPDRGWLIFSKLTHHGLSVLS